MGALVLGSLGELDDAEPCNDPGRATAAGAGSSPTSCARRPACACPASHTTQSVGCVTSGT